MFSIFSPFIRYISNFVEFACSLVYFHSYGNSFALACFLVYFSLSVTDGSTCFENTGEMLVFDHSTLLSNGRRIQRSVHQNDKRMCRAFRSRVASAQTEGKMKSAQR